MMSGKIAQVLLMRKSSREVRCTKPRTETHSLLSSTFSLNSSLFKVISWVPPHVSDDKEVGDE